jgi:glycosyltransferase involved in cell wall biosynthesis
MPRVLIATNEPNFTMGMIEGYRKLGWEVVTGLLNFRICAARYDIVHFQWPEEFTEWRVPTARSLEEIDRLLRYWREKSILIFTVNNLHPHQHKSSELYHQLYSLFYKHCHAVTHYTQASKHLVLKEFPVAGQNYHLVHQPANYEVTLANQIRRGDCRQKWNLSSKDFVILVLGSLRSWDEMTLVRKAYDKARINRKRLLMAGKLSLIGSRWQIMWMKFFWSCWLWSRKAAVETRFVPEEEVSQFIDSCDIAIVPRLSGLNSGIIHLGMTFGKALVYPDIPGFAEYFTESPNFVYVTGDASSLAEKMEEASRLDIAAIGLRNAQVSARWTWKRMVMTCLKEVAMLGMPLAASIKRFVDEYESLTGPSE